MVRLTPPLQPRRLPLHNLPRCHKHIRRANSQWLDEGHTIQGQGVARGHEIRKVEFLVHHPRPTVIFQELAVGRAIGIILGSGGQLINDVGPDLHGLVGVYGRVAEGGVRAVHDCEEEGTW